MHFAASSWGIDVLLAWQLNDGGEGTQLDYEYESYRVQELA